MEHLDEVEHILSCVVSGFVSFAPDRFALEQVEEALGNSILMTVCGASGADFALALPAVRAFAGRLRAA